MKVLIISHNPVSTYQSMGKTFVSLFSQFRKDELCQMYIYPTIPDIDVCGSYFRVTDKDVLRSYLHFGRLNSREILSSEINPRKHERFENPDDSRLYRKKKTEAVVLARDLMWKCARTVDRKMKEWLDREKPTCIFLAPGEAKFLYDLAMKISDACQLPIVTYICDEFYFVEKQNSLMGNVRLGLLRQKIEQVMHRSACLVTICDRLRELYSGHFGVQAETVMTGSSFPIAEQAKQQSSVSSISYFGNLAYRRYDSIADIGRALDQINREDGTDDTLELHTGHVSEEAKCAFEGIRSIHLAGYVTGADFDREFHDAEILLHTESFEPSCMDRVKNSVSTKIADSLGSGIPLLAYGPADIASISYLHSGQCACVVSDREQLVSVLRELFQKEQLRREYAEKGLLMARQFHESAGNSRRLHRLLEQISRTGMGEQQ